MADRYYDDGSGSIYDPNADQSQQTSQPYAPPAGNPTDAWIPQIKAWYQQYLGRPASDADVQGHLGNPQGLTVQKRQPTPLLRARKLRQPQPRRTPEALAIRCSSASAILSPRIRTRTRR
jgi:hypothetical protein